MIVDVTTFSLASGVSEEEFLAVDRRWQTELVPNREGFVRRTTAHRDGAWVVVTLWGTEDNAQSFERASADHDVRRAFAACADPETVRSARYDTLD